MTKINNEFEQFMRTNGLTREKLVRFLKNSNLFTDNFFSLCLKNKDFNPMQYLIRLFLNNDKIVITNVVGQYQIISSGGKIAVLDAYGEEIKTVETIDPKTQEKKTTKITIKYNIEIQRVSEGANPKRARYYSATLDTEYLGEKQDYKELTESYVIFITEHDVYKKGQTIYYVDRYLEWKDKEGKVIGREPFNDGTHIMYINASQKGKKNLPKEKLTELERALHDFFCRDYNDMYCEELREPVKYLKDTKEGEIFMRNLFELAIKQTEERVRKETEQKLKEMEKAKILAEKQAKKAEKQAEKQAKQAKLEGLLETAKNLLQEGFSIDKVAKFTKLKVADIRALTL